MESRTRRRRLSCQITKEGIFSCGEADNPCKGKLVVLSVKAGKKVQISIWTFGYCGLSICKTMI